MTAYETLHTLIEGQDLPLIVNGIGGAFMAISTVPGEPDVIRLVHWDGEHRQVTHDFWPDGEIVQYFTTK